MLDKPEPPEHLDRLAHATIGAAIEVHQHLGPGHLESIYERALAIELGLRRIPFQSQVLVPVPYKGQLVGEQKVDILVGGELVVELKAIERLLEVHRAQVLSYLKAGGFTLGLLINFDVKLLKEGIRRVIWSPDP